jgi:hypothetical protein
MEGAYCAEPPHRQFRYGRSSAVFFLKQVLYGILYQPYRISPDPNGDLR